MTIDEKISLNIKRCLKTKFGSLKIAAEKLEMNRRYLENTLYKIKNGSYPSMKKIKKFAEVCDCQITDFFNID